MLTLLFELNEKVIYRMIVMLETKYIVFLNTFSTWYHTVKIHLNLTPLNITLR